MSEQEREAGKSGEPEQADVEGHMRVRVSRAELEQALQGEGGEVALAVRREEVEQALASDTPEVEAHAYKYNG